MAKQTTDFFEMKPHHCGISVPDLEASIVWYCDVLGFTVTRRGVIEAAHAKNAFLKHGDFYIELFEVEGAVPLPESRRYPNQDIATHGTKHIAFEVQDLRKVTETLKQRGVDIAMERTTNTIHFMRDNAGNLIELMESSDHH